MKKKRKSASDDVIGWWLQLVVRLVVVHSAI